MGRAWLCESCRATLGVRLADHHAHRAPALELRPAAVTLEFTPAGASVVCRCGHKRPWHGGRVIAPVDRLAPTG